MLAIAWFTDLREETEKARRVSMCSTVSFSSALGPAIIGIVVVSGKWDKGRDWRTGLIFVQHLLVDGAI
jgi:hypothetical protein